MTSLTIGPARTTLAARGPEDRTETRNPALPIDQLGMRVAGAVTGAATWGLQGAIFSGAARATTRMAAQNASLASTPVARIAPLLAKGNRATIYMAAAGAAMGWRGADRIREKLTTFKPFTNAQHKDSRRAMIEGPLMGAAVLGGGIGVVGVGARAAFASKMMGHERISTIARFTGKHVGRWAGAGAVAGLALGAATGLTHSDPAQTWGTVVDTALDPKSAKRNYLYMGGVLGGIMGLSAYMASGKPTAGVKAALKGAAVFGSVAYMGNAVYRMTTTGIQAAGAANKRWSSPADGG